MFTIFRALSTTSCIAFIFFCSRHRNACISNCPFFHAKIVQSRSEGCAACGIISSNAWSNLVPRALLLVYILYCIHCPNDTTTPHRTQIFGLVGMERIWLPLKKHTLALNERWKAPSRFRKAPAVMTPLPSTSKKSNAALSSCSRTNIPPLAFFGTWAVEDGLHSLSGHPFVEERGERHGNANFVCCRTVRLRNGVCAHK